MNEPFKPVIRLDFSELMPKALVDALGPEWMSTPARFVLFCPDGTTGDLYAMEWGPCGTYYTGTFDQAILAQQRQDIAGRGKLMRLVSPDALAILMKASREQGQRDERERLVYEVTDALNEAYENGANEPNMGPFVLDALKKAAKASAP